MAISLKRVKIVKKLHVLWRAYRNSQVLFRTVPWYHPRPHTAASSLRLGVRNPNPSDPKLQSCYLRTSNLASTFTRSIRKSPLQILEKNCIVSFSKQVSNSRHVIGTDNDQTQNKPYLQYLTTGTKKLYI